MDTIYRDLVLDKMRFAVMCEYGLAHADADYHVDADTFRNDVESEVGFEVCTATVIETKHLRGGRSVPAKFSTVVVRISEEGLDEAGVTFE